MATLEGKTILVTGGGSGIGLATARGCLNEGARVAITGRDEAKLRRAAADLAGGDRLLPVGGDATDPAQVERVVRATVDGFGPIDVLVNNAGANIKERTLRDLNPERWRLLLGSNLDSAFYYTHAVLPAMRERRDGLVVFVSSIAGKRAGPLGGAAYAAAKFGMRALGICLAAEERENGVRVSVIYPGEVDTPILVNRPQPVSAEQRRQILQPEDVAAAVLFVVALPARVSVPELVIKPTSQTYI